MTRSMLIVNVRFNCKNARWYRLSPKIVKALYQERNFTHESVTKLTRNLIGLYINVPITPYYNHHVVIGVGKIIDVKWTKYNSRRLCTRSQYVDTYRLRKHLFSSYHYLRHDYSFWSRLNILVNLINFRNEIK